LPSSFLIRQIVDYRLLLPENKAHKIEYIIFLHLRQESGWIILGAASATLSFGTLPCSPTSAKTGVCSTKTGIFSVDKPFFSVIGYCSYRFTAKAKKAGA
jgi:hypothetical protein